VVILEKRNNDIVANVEGVYRLINFLIRARQRARAWDGNVFINLKAL